MSSQTSKNDAPISRTFWGTLQVLIICATVVLVVYFHAPHTAAPRRLWVPAVVEKNGSVTTLAETRQMHFWTPSAETKDYLPKISNSIAAQDKWQVISNDDMVVQFGNLLHSNKDVLGYRRYVVWGHGRSVFKPGWWWTVNVFTNFSPAEMGQTYQNYWKCGAPVMIEVVENRGSDQ